MARLALISVFVAVGAVPARAGIAVDAGAPFSVAELCAALAVRGVGAADVGVRCVSPTAVELSTAVGRLRVELGALRGAAAARVVALQLAPMSDVGSDMGPPGLSEAGGPERVGRARWALGVAVGAGRGPAGIDFLLTSLRAELVQHRGPWRFGVGAGWLHGLAKSPDGTAPATADLLPVRAFAGASAGPIEAVIGPELVRYRVTAAKVGYTAGVSGGLRVRLISDGPWRAVASADVDGLRHRVVIARDGKEFAATPRVAFVAGLGVLWEGP